MKLLVAICILLFLGSTSLSIIQKDSAEWVERCHTSTARYYLNPKQIFKGLYANPNFKGQLLADVWVKLIPRTDTREGQHEYENHLKELKKKAKDKYKSYSYRLAKMQFKCESRIYWTEEAYDYDSEGNLIYKWPTTIADILHEDSVTPGSIAECIMSIACKQLSEAP